MSDDFEQKQYLDQVLTDLAQDEHEDEANVLSTAIADDALTNPKTRDILVQAADKLRGASGDQAFAPNMPSSSPITIMMPESDPEATPHPGFEDPRIPEERMTGDVAPAPAPVPREEMGMVSQGEPEGPASLLAKRGDIQGAYGLLQSGINAQKQGIAGQAEAMAKGYAEQASIANRTIEQLNAQSAQFAKAQQEVDTKIDAQLDKQTRAIEDFNTLKIDPNQFWGNASTPDKLLMGIGMALSAYGGKVENSIAIINEAVDRDISAQKANADLAATGISQRSNLITQLRGSLQDKQQAEQIARANQLQQAKLLTESAMANANSEVARNNGKILIGQLDMQIAEAMGKASGGARQQVIASMEAGQNSGGPIPWEQAKQEGLIRDSDAKLAVPGYGLVGEGQNPRDVSEGIASFKDLKGNLTEMQMLAKKHGGELLTTDVVNRMNTLKEQITLKLKSTEHLGAMGADVQSLVDRMVGMNLNYVSPRRTAIRVASGEAADPMFIKLQQLGQDMDRSFANKMDSTFRVGTPKLIALINSAKRSGIAASARDR